MDPGKHSRLAAGLALVALLAVIAGHVGFLVRDPRLPRDLGLYYARVPDLYHALESPISAAGTLFEAAREPGGGYQILLATYLRVVGRGPLPFQLVDVAWLAALLALVYGLARRSWGPWAGLGAVLLAGAFPAVFVYARTAWIHIPEAVLLLVVVAAWRVDPDLRRRGTALVAGLAGCAVLLLRPSALIWIGLLLAVAAWRWRRNRESVHRVHTGAVLVAWGLATLPAILSLDDYLAAKLEARARYAVAVPGLDEQLFVTIGPVAGAIALLGAGLIFWPPRRRWIGLLWAWTLTPVGLFALFRAGIDNFTISAVALALLGAAGLSRRPALGLPLAGAVFLLAQVPQWLPPPAPGSWAQHVGGRLGLALKPSFRNPYVPHTSGHGGAVGDLLAATCPERGGRCLVAVDQGLFQPFAEDPGALELFLGGFDSVQIVPLAGMTATPGSLPLRALAHYECPEMDEKWRERFPDSLGLLRALGKAHDLQPVWTGDVGEGCHFSWLVPGGIVADPARVPAERAAVLEVPELPPAPLSPIRAPSASDEVDVEARRVLGLAMDHALAGELTEGDRAVLARFVERVGSRGGIWRREVVALRSDDGERFVPLEAVPPMPSTAAPEVVLGDDGRLYLFAVDTDLDALLPIAEADPAWFGRHGLPGPGALRLHVSADGRTWQEEPGFGVEGLVGAAVFDPAVVRAEDGSWRLYYVGLPVEAYLRPAGLAEEATVPLHVATSDDLVHWTHRGTAAVLGAPGATVFCDGPSTCTLLSSGITRWTSDDGGLTFAADGPWEAGGFGPEALHLADGRLRVYFDGEQAGFPVWSATREADGSWSMGDDPAIEGRGVNAVTAVEMPDGSFRMFAERGLGPPGSGSARPPSR